MKFVSKCSTKKEIAIILFYWSNLFLKNKQNVLLYYISLFTRKLIQ